jgi:glycosyltransferase involved in cell wall biosynthesis
MKILIPQSSHISTTDKNIVLGGVEKFIDDLHTNIKGVILEEFSKEKKFSKKRMQELKKKHNPDVLLINNIQWAKTCSQLNIPLICIFHEPCVRDIRVVTWNEQFAALKKCKAHVYMVSPKQFKYHKELQANNFNYKLSRPIGYIRPSYCQLNYKVSSDHEYDVATIGRNSSDKNPFLIHQKLAKTNLSSLVMTTRTVMKSAAHNEYQAKNSTWFDPQHTKYNLPHAQVIENLSKAKVFISTWDKESWGITAMEALGCGVPVILLTDNTNTHASEIIPADKKHVVKLPRSVNSSTLEMTVRKLISATDQKARKRISSETKIKHSRSEWRKHINEILVKRLV